MKSNCRGPEFNAKCACGAACGYSRELDALASVGAHTLMHTNPPDTFSGIEKK